MKRSDKPLVVQELEHIFQQAVLLVVARPKGLSVAESTDLRRKMRSAEANFKVTKNSLAKRALANTPLKELACHFTEETAIGWSDDPLAAAKVAVEFAKDNLKLIVLGGALQNRLLSAQGIQELAILPSKDQLRAGLLRLIQTPATRIACTLQEAQTQLVRVLKARASETSTTH